MDETDDQENRLVTQWACLEIVFIKYSIVGKHCLLLFEFPTQSEWVLFDQI